MVSLKGIIGDVYRLYGQNVTSTENEMETGLQCWVLQEPTDQDQGGVWGKANPDTKDWCSNNRGPVCTPPKS